MKYENNHGREAERAKKSAVISLIAPGLNILNSPVADYSSGNVFNVLDVVYLR